MGIGKEEVIENHFREIMKELGLDLENPSLKETPKRFAKMIRNELCEGLFCEKPIIKVFPNDEGYNQMLIQKDITLFSMCEHHFVPIIGKAHVAYIPNGNVIGLSKIIRIVRYWSRRPQLQERLTQQIAKDFQEILKTKDVAVVLEAQHHCCNIRGVRDPNTWTITSFVGGAFETTEARDEFMALINKK